MRLPESTPLRAADLPHRVGAATRSIAPVAELDAQLRVALDEQAAAGRHRRRRVVEGRHGAEIEIGGRRCLNFCSNDYLGLAADPRLVEAAKLALDAHGTGSGAAALVSGYGAQHRRLEEALAEFTGRPRALLFSSGWAANCGVLRALLGRNDTLIADELNHASLIDGGRLSGAHYVRVKHRDLGAYADALAGGQGRVVVATDSLFSMDGDLAPLAGLAGLCARSGAALMVDDAHGFGVLGATGRGATEQAGGPPPEIYVATLGKALGVAGAFVAGSETLIDFLIQRARSWVFSTAPPPALAAAACRALEIVRAEPERRARLTEHIQRFRRGSRELGIPVGESTTPIQPLILGDEARALALSQSLFERGLWVVAIRPPTVPPGSSRLRITLSAAHTGEQIDRLLDALATGLKAII